MKISNIIKGGAFLAGMAAFSAMATPAAAETLQSPDSDALVAGYQVIQFNLKECLAVATKSAGVSANGTGLVSPSVKQIAAKMCEESRMYKPKLEAMAKEKNFELPTELPYYLTAQYSALVRNQDANFGSQYLNDQIASHESALAIFQEEAATGTDPDIKAAAADVIPTIQENLATLKKLAGK
jgi:putative membrane protein